MFHPKAWVKKMVEASGKQWEKEEEEYEGETKTLGKYL